MIEILRWLSLGLSLFAMGLSLYSCLRLVRMNKRLKRRNLDLFVEKVGLLKKIEEYEAEIQRLRKLLTKLEE